MATEEEITDHNDNCAVCWEKKENAVFFIKPTYYLNYRYKNYVK
jgi:hypothetical protein